MYVEGARQKGTSSSASEDFARLALDLLRSYSLTMSASRLVLSSPFDMPQRKRPPDKPIKVLTSYNGCKVRYPHVNNIMVDTRVVRRSIFSTPKTQNSQIASNNTTVHFDRRLLGGSLFANPIVKVTGGGNEVIRERKKKVCTPSPVKGRKHVCIQTDTERIDECYQDIKPSPFESLANGSELHVPYNNKQ